MVKFWISAICLLACVPGFAAPNLGGVSDGGGDPLEIAATAFPKPELVDSAIELLKARLAFSPYPAFFKDRVAQEADDLRANRKYLYLPMLIILGNAGPAGYPMPHDMTRFVSLGAMTRLQAGAPVFFSQRALEHDVDGFAQLLLHEILHHVLGPASADERYVEEFTDSLLLGTRLRSLEAGIEHGVALREGFVSLAALFKLVVQRVATQTDIGLTGLPLRGEELARLLQRAESIDISKNAADLTEEDFAKEVAKLIFNNTKFVPLVLDPLMFVVGIQIDHIQGKLFENAIQALEGFAAQVGSRPAWLDADRSVGCKGSKSFFFRECAEPVLIRDLFILSMINEMPSPKR